ncbi:MAG TPA: ATP-binding protein [Jiangellales bacterium]|nr:ATP-binding protein [Jiangellales bacterium]
MVLEKIELDDLVSDAIAWAARRYSQVRFHSSLEPVVVQGDRTLVRNAVGNLLDNAAKWSDTGGLVEVCLRPDDLTVRATGPASMRGTRRTFSSASTGPARRGRSRGAGLGLAIVREVADYDGDEVIGSLAEEVAGLIGQKVTFETDGDGLDQESSP